ncbi:MAG TPA: response regulator [Candidatus Methanoperedens sp.]|nr:response regulator [Candidatus Methanoperedens sp.]
MVRVKIIGGDPGDNDVLARMLREAGAEAVLSAQTPVEADAHADLVLLDQALLTAAGAPLLERMRGLHPAAQICLLAPFAHRRQVAGPVASALWDALYLPAQPEDVGDLVGRTETWMVRRTRSERRRRILVVDDEPSVREASAAHLEQQGNVVDTAADALEAFGKLQLHPYDLVITDLQMPGMDGVALLAKIRVSFPLLPVVLATGFATVETAVAALRTGATDFLRKPFSSEDLTQVVERALRFGALARENADLEQAARAEKTRLRERQYELRVLAEAIAGMSQAGLPAEVADIWLHAAYRVVDFLCGALYLVYPEPELVVLDAGNEAGRLPELFDLLRQRAPALLGGSALAGVRIRQVAGVAGRGARAGAPPGDAHVHLLGPEGSPCAGLVLMFAAGEAPTPAQESFLRSLTAPAAQALEKQHALAEEARQRERAMVAGMHQGVLLADPHGRILVLNASARDLLALTPDEECGSLSRLQSEHEIPLQDAVFELLRSGADTLSREFALRRPAERILTLDLTTIRDTARAPLAVVGLLRDITEVRETERMKTEFVTIVSHELRTPLTSIKNCHSLLLGGGTGEITPVQERFLRMAQTSVDRIIRLVDDLLDVARIESGGIPLRREPTDLSRLLREVGNEFEYLALERRLRLAFSGFEEPLIVPADHERLRQVFYNLVHNAVKFSPPGGTIEVRAVRPGGAQPPPAIRDLARPPQAPLVEVQVLDEGAGIAPGERERIFERFQQVESTLRREHGSGVGLGLPISRGIVRSHGGEILAEGRDGGGNVFRVFLPQTVAPDDEAAHGAGESGCRNPESGV